MKKSIVIIGGRKKAKILAKSILQKRYEVTVINESYEDCLSLSEVDGISVVQGDGTKPYVLEDANIRNADIAIAMTSNDEDNLMICQLCKALFSIRKTVAVVSDPKKLSSSMQWESTGLYVQYRQSRTSLSNKPLSTISPISFPSEEETFKLLKYVSKAIPQQLTNRYGS